MIRDNLPSPDYAFAYILSTSAYPEKIEQIIMQQKSETTWWKKKVEVLLNRDPHHPQAMILQEKKNFKLLQGENLHWIVRNDI